MESQVEANSVILQMAKKGIASMTDLKEKSKTWGWGPASFIHFT